MNPGDTVYRCYSDPGHFEVQAFTLTALSAQEGSPYGYGVPPGGDPDEGEYVLDLRKVHRTPEEAVAAHVAWLDGNVADAEKRLAAWQERLRLTREWRP